MSSPLDKTVINGMTGTPMPPEAVPGRSSDAVKSAGRVLDIFEFFYRFRRPARGVDIANFLEIPKSSANGLLKTLVDTGYLTFNPKTKSYFLSFRLVRFGNWLSSFYFGPNRIIAMMEELQDKSGECVALTVQNGLYMQFVAMLPTPGLPNVFGEGRKTPILGSATGGALLMTLDDGDISDIVWKVSRGKARKAREAESQEVLATIRRFRVQGYSANYWAPVVPNTMSVAMALPRLAGNVPLVLSVGGLKERIAPRELEIVGMMRDCIAEHLEGAEAVFPEADVHAEIAAQRL
jgi:DNA-binding IclR family transcriptional regulator